MNKKCKVMPSPERHVNEILLKMKLLTMLLFALFATASASSYSQATKFNLNMKDVSISEVFQKIEEQSEFIILFNEKTLDINRKVDVKVTDKTVDKILDQIFEGYSDSYKIFDRQIAIFSDIPPVSSDNNIPRSTTTELTANAPPTKLIKGKVLDDTGAVLPGVSIVVAGSTRGVTSDTDGSFSIDVDPSATLNFSFIGMESRAIQVVKLTEIIVLKSLQSELDEVTVVAFGKQKKESVVASISTVKPSELRIPSSNLTNALAGRVGGIISYQRSGEPGKDEAQFFVRGVTTFAKTQNAAGAPLILINNVEVTSFEFARLNVDDIASFSVMKDASASALYGSRGANGVILVTTKQGMAGPTKLSFRSEGRVSGNTRMVDMADPITYMKLQNEAIKTRNPFFPLPYSPEKIANTASGIDPVAFPSVDWYNYLLKPYTFNQSYNMSLSGGGNFATYYVGASYSRDNGNLKESSTNKFNNNINVNKVTFNSSVVMNLTKTTVGTMRFSATFDDQVGPDVNFRGLTGGSAVYAMSRNTSPVDFLPYYEKDASTSYLSHILFGSRRLPEGDLMNPYALMMSSFKQVSQSSVSSIVEVNQKMDAITKGLSGKLMLNFQRYSSFGLSRAYTPFYYEHQTLMDGSSNLLPLNPEKGTDYIGQFKNGDANINRSYYLESYLNYSRTFAEKHEVGGVLVYTMREFLAGNKTSVIDALPQRNQGIAGRFTYAYDSRYFMEANFGYNGSERFDMHHRWGFFPSIGAGWTLSNENFFKPLKNSITKLRLKGSYGMSGNDNIGVSAQRFLFLSNVVLDGPQFGYFGSQRDQFRNSISFNQYANPLIGWETSYKTNLGLELILFKDLAINVDLFKERRVNILQERSEPSTMGLKSHPFVSIGKAKSKGFEISADYNHSFTPDFFVSFRGNFTYAGSAYVEFEEPDYALAGLPYKSVIGRSLGQQWGLVAERLFIDDTEVNNSPTQKAYGEYGAGDIKYKDINNDGKIDNNDQVAIGTPVNPEIIYGAGISAGYKGFDFSCFFQGSGNSSFFISPQSISPFVGLTDQTALLKSIADSHWSENNRDLYAFWPRLSKEGNVNNNQQSTWWLRDGSFLRLKQLEIGYTIPAKLLKWNKNANLRLYLSASNLYTWSSFKMWDIEMAGNGLGYPVQRVFSLGLNLNL